MNLETDAPELAGEVRRAAAALDTIRAAAHAFEAGHITRDELATAVLETGVASWG